VDCFAAFVSFPAGSVISTPASAWTKAPVTPVNFTSCQEACRVEPRCQYWQVSGTACSLKLATTSPAADSYVAVKLTTNSYTIWQAAADEYGLQARQAQPLPTEANSPVEPWRCLTACDDAAGGCAGVFLARRNSTWSCWSLEVVRADSGSSGGIKLALSQLDTYFWDMPDQVRA
jgi:hypothetical protein